MSNGFNGRSQLHAKQHRSQNEYARLTPVQLLQTTLREAEYTFPRAYTSCHWRMNDPCAYCGYVADSWDHMDAKSKGGSSFQSNLTRSCTQCNQRKGPMSLLQFLVLKNKYYADVHKTFGILLLKLYWSKRKKQHHLTFDMTDASVSATI